MSTALNGLRRTKKFTGKTLKDTVDSVPLRISQDKEENVFSIKMNLTPEIVAFKMKIRRIALVERDNRTIVRHLWKTLTANEWVYDSDRYS